ncbi:hypothetical protein [Arthrobacter sp. IK3]|uniref:hypothetical protein n=1 Tax=Arthrobacter sp. IK3 TaxID=3448169 RepID=UPI003EDF0BF0
MSLDYISKNFKVPAVRGARVATKELNPRFGTVIGARGNLVRVRLDGVDDSVLLHPRKGLHYLESTDKSSAKAA